VSAPVAILDRDGTLVIDREYLADPAGLEFEPGAEEGVRLLHAARYRLIVITNQSGVGRGLIPIEQLRAMNERLFAMVAATGARLEGIYFCPHLPAAGCECRKPGQALMRKAAAELGFHPRTAVVIGDRDSDVEFGRRAGARTVRITQQPLPADAVRADFEARDLAEAARLLSEPRPPSATRRNRR
jgi:D-glycero-D-manno-heptose 1,7-bisphosphate phosphatase